MDTVNSRFVETAVQIADKMARAWFSDPDAIADVVSVAWEFAQAGKGNACSIAWYAVKRVRAGRQFPESERSIHRPCPERREAWKQDSGFDLGQFTSGEDPAEAAALRIDFADWRESLSEHLRQVCDALAAGNRTGEMAARLQCSPGRISQIRRLLESRWNEFYAE